MTVMKQVMTAYHLSPPLFILMTVMKQVRDVMIAYHPVTASLTCFTIRMTVMKQVIQTTHPSTHPSTPHYNLHPLLSK
jgi:hypothetical protein